MPMPCLSGPLQDDGGRFQCEGETLRVEWTLAPVGGESLSRRLHLLAHFGAQAVAGVAAPPGTLLHGSGVALQGAVQLRLARGAVYMSLQAG